MLTFHAICRYIYTLVVKQFSRAFFQICMAKALHKDKPLPEKKEVNGHITKGHFAKHMRNNKKFMRINVKG